MALSPAIAWQFRRWPECRWVDELSMPVPGRLDGLSEIHGRVLGPALGCPAGEILVALGDISRMADGRRFVRLYLQRRPNGRHGWNPVPLDFFGRRIRHPAVPVYPSISTRELVAFLQGSH